MKKWLLILVMVILPFNFLACSGTDEDVLYLLNWGEYINEDLVAAFTDETGITVEISTVDSNEGFKSELDSGTGNYDIVVPSDYMAELLYDNGYLQQIDLTKLTNYDAAAFLPGVAAIMNQLFVDNDEVTTPYSVGIPYFWGLFGIMYNNNIAGLADFVEANGWGTVFGPAPAGLGSSIRVGLYDVERFDYAAALLYAADSGLYDVVPSDMNVFSNANISLVETILAQRDYTEWATDMLKKNIAAGELDAAFLYVGDFFDTYLLLAGDADATTGAEAEAAASGIGIYIPSNTIAFVDMMVIPVNAEHVDNAHRFIDFFLDPENAYVNSDIVGYTTTLQETYDMILNATHGDLVRQAMVQNHPYAPMAVSVAATPLTPYTDDQNEAIITMLNRVKVGAN
ncbi:MAG: extracellular solute-binding protein [Candidatus Izemoplasmatales bacterium]